MNNVEYTGRWHTKRLASLFVENYSKNFNLTCVDAYQFCYGNIVPKKKYEMTEDLVETYRKYTLIEPNDIMINGLNLNYDFISQRVALVQKKGIMTSAYICLRPRTLINAKYFSYLFKSLDARKVFHGMGTGIRLTLSFDAIKNLLLPVPSLSEQDQIVRHLDWKVSEINRLINIKKREMNVLKEQISVLISQEFISLDYVDKVRLSICCSKIGSGKTPRGGATVYTTEGVLFIRSQNVYPTGIVMDGAYYISDDIDEEMASTRVVNGDVLLNITGGSIGRACTYTLEMPANVNQHVCIIRPIKELLDSEYLAYFLNSKLGQDLIWGNQKPGNRQSLTFPQIGSFRIPLPDVVQQREMVGKISMKIKKIEYSFAIIENEINLLQEYKTRLIYDVITGQVDVRNIVVPEYEYVEECSDADSDSDDESEDVSDEEV